MKHLVVHLYRQVVFSNVDVVFYFFKGGLSSAIVKGGLSYVMPFFLTAFIHPPSIKHAIANRFSKQVLGRPIVPFNLGPTELVLWIGLFFRACIL